jgi:DNA-binding beta-propeller fold protein YncE
MKPRRASSGLRLAALVATLALGLAASPRYSHAAEPSNPPAQFLLEWGKRGSAPGEFDFPIGVAIAPDGEVVVTDFYNGRVQRFGASGEFRTSVAVLPNPGGIAIDVDGTLYLTHFPAMKSDEDKKPDQVTVYSARGELLRKWGKTGSGPGEFDYPGGIALGHDGQVFVADQTNRRVQVFDREGRFLRQWGEYGIKEGQFGGNVSPKSRVGGPQFVVVDSGGAVFTTEGSVCRVQKFTAEGRFVLAWGDPSDKAGSFGGAWGGGNKGLRGPVGICFDHRGRLWVSAVSGRIQSFTPDGTYLQGLGAGSGHEPGQFRAPHGLAADREGHLYIVDSYNHRVQKFAIGP